MDFKIPKTKEHDKALGGYEKDQVSLAYTFTKDIYKELHTLLKAVVLFGSVARDTKHPHEDIDILLIVDDLSIAWTPEVTQTYQVICEKTVAKVSPRIHVTTLRLTTFWEYTRSADPVVINILRDGVALMDTGFFDPLQTLLKQGKIRATEESVLNYMVRSIDTLDKSRSHIFAATVDLYWACIDAAHAALMRVGELPPTPEHITDMLYSRFCDKKLLSRKDADTMHFFYKLYKAITHNQIDSISGEQYEMYHVKAKRFVDIMKKIVERNV